jgi:hypothetical protein
VFNARHEVIALYDLATDLGESKNLANVPGQKTRIGRMVKMYEEIRHSTRSTPGPKQKNDIPVDLFKKDK